MNTTAERDLRRPPIVTVLPLACGASAHTASYPANRLRMNGLRTHGKSDYISFTCKSFFLNALLTFYIKHPGVRPSPQRFGARNSFVSGRHFT
jgi:hypothetical protein